jgi:hypothetical protein
MIKQEDLFGYLEKKIPNFLKTRKAKTGELSFTCPNIANHKFPGKAPTATFVPGTNKVSCFICSWKGTMFDAIRVLEKDKVNKTDADITDYLIGELHLDMYSELTAYQKYNWSLIPLLKNTKNPFEADWRIKEYRNKIQHIKWLNNGLNIGLNCELNKLIVIDVDCKKPIPEESKANREEIIKLLENSGTLKAQTPSGGNHYVYLWDEDLRKQEVNLAGTQIDTRTEGQIVIAPSIINGIPYKWENLGAEIKVVPPELKIKLLELKKLETKKESIPVPEKTAVEPLKLKNNNLDGCCNDTFVSIGGMLIKQLTPEHTEFVLNIMNRYLLESPMPASSIKSMMNSLTDYKGNDEESLEKIIYEYMKMMQTDITMVDIIKGAFNGDDKKSGIVYKYLSKFVKDGKAIRLGRGRYQYKEKIEWVDTAPELVDEYKYKIPFFNDVAVFQDKDVILLGAKTNDGKTTIAMNILREVIEQGIKPYYIYSEAGSRFQKTSQLLGITGKYFHTYHENPLAIELEYNAFSIIDWLHLEHKELTDTVLKHLNDELQRKGGILVIFTQLKTTSEWFAPNLIDHYPTFAARYMQDNDSKTEGHWDIQKIKEPRGNFCNYILPCEYNQETKVFKKKDII